MANINLRALEIARACVLNTQRRMCAILRIHTRGILHPFIIYTRTMREQNKYIYYVYNNIFLWYAGYAPHLGGN